VLSETEQRLFRDCAISDCTSSHCLFAVPYRNGFSNRAAIQRITLSVVSQSNPFICKG
jgi:hypothetical protein